MTLPDDDARAVEAFLLWAYSGKFDYGSYDSVASLVEAYRFADKILADSNNIVDSATTSDRARGQYIAPTTCLHLYQADLQDTQLASYALKGIVYNMMADNSEEGTWETQLAPWFKIPLLMENFTKELLRYKRKPWGSPSSWNGCHFHKHKEGSKCSASVGPSK